jgi:nucleosome binding factor SPN SPT16 subunit
MQLMILIECRTHSNSNKPDAHSNTIPSGQIENVKEWIDSCDIPFSEGPVNLNWSAIMKTVTDDVSGNVIS